MKNCKTNFSETYTAQKYQALHQPDPEYSDEKPVGVNKHKFAFSEENMVNRQSFLQ